MARLCGAGVAKDLLFTARKVRADEALKIGLANRVFPQDRLMKPRPAPVIMSPRIVSRSSTTRIASSISRFIRSLRALSLSGFRRT